MLHSVRSIIGKIDRKTLPYIAIVAVASGLTILWEVKLSNQESKLPDGKIQEKSADTYIPNGFVLVPIEIANKDALDGLFGDFGVVDLFFPATKAGEKPFPVAQHMKLLRAPKNPHQFAVLAPEALASRFARLNEPLFAVIKNPLQDTAIKRVEENKQRRRISVAIPEADES